MKIFIDTNTLLDVLTGREPFYENSAIIWSMVEKGLLKGYISAISVNNIYYIVKKQIGKSEAEKLVDKILKDFKVISLTFEILKLARTMKEKDFPQKKLEIVEPGEFIEKFDEMQEIS